MRTIDFFERSMGHRFKNEKLLSEALTHSSYANEKHDGSRCNERLEFLGDSVLSIVVSDYLFKNCQDLDEGYMTKARATIVCEKSLAEAARNEEIGNYLLLGKGEDKTGGRERNSVLSDAVEALIAALYLDANMEAAKSWIMKTLGHIIDKAISGDTYRDYKTILQEKVQGEGTEKIEYVVVGEQGPDHDKSFEIVASFGGSTIGRGKGKSKKTAEQYAAKEALEKYNE